MKRFVFDSYIESLISLQKAVDDLIDGSPDIETPNNYNPVALKSLTEILKGKEGRFRHNMLGRE